MWAWLLCLIFVSVFPSAAQAIYTEAEVVSNETQVDGRTMIVLNVVGSNNESPVQLKFNVPANPSMAGLRYTVGDKVTELNTALTVSTLPALQPGQTILPLARPAPPAPTAKQIWQGKLNKLDRYLQVQAQGVTAVAADITALIADLNASYATGHLD